MEDGFQAQPGSKTGEIKGPTLPSTFTRSQVGAYARSSRDQFPPFPNATFNFVSCPGFWQSRTHHHFVPRRFHPGLVPQGAQTASHAPTHRHPSTSSKLIRLSVRQRVGSTEELSAPALPTEPASALFHSSSHHHRPRRSRNDRRLRSWLEFQRARLSIKSGSA